MKMLYDALLNIIDKWGCHHEWQLIRETYVETDFGGSYTGFHWVCTKCGKFKNTKTNKG